SAIDSSEKAIELHPGEQLTVSKEGVTQIQPADVSHTTAWEKGQLVFDDEPLSSVVERVNRYAARPLRFGDERTAALRINGVFNTHDIEGLVTTLTQYFPIEATDTGESIVLSHR